VRRRQQGAATQTRSDSAEYRNAFASGSCGGMLFRMSSPRFWFGGAGKSRAYTSRKRSSGAQGCYSRPVDGEGTVVVIDQDSVHRAGFGGGSELSAERRYALGYGPL